MGSKRLKVTFGGKCGQQLDVVTTGAWRMGPTPLKNIIGGLSAYD